MLGDQAVSALVISVIGGSVALIAPSLLSFREPHEECLMLGVRLSTFVSCCIIVDQSCV
jgi:hypothetical protein